MMAFNSITVVGLGYIGLPTAAMFASRKKSVIGVDVNRSVVDVINKGMVHIVEPELDILVHAAVTEGYLQATTEPQHSDAFLIAVPTPFDSDHKPDLSYIEVAATSIAAVLKKGDLVILESTSPVGATERMAELLASLRADLTFPQDAGDAADVNIAHCPERVLPGHTVRELVQNDRVIGGMSQTCSRRSVELYKTFVEGECIITNARTAEMTKLTENSFRDVNIAFANELSVICEKFQINVWELISLANRHPRVNILQPGPGVGGHCIAVDPWFIVAGAPDESRLITAARRVNDDKPRWVVRRVEDLVASFLRDHPEKSLSELVIACFGLSFKPDIDDFRESPALSIARNLIDKFKCKILFVEPNISDLSKIPVQGAELVEIDSALEVADIAVLLVDHREFKAHGRPRTRYLVDTKGLWLQNER